ncbi:MAG: aminopeptidase [Gorillibacterium sp.]|nr:aminopeptidase [Gorillibacterium sp.]
MNEEQFKRNLEKYAELTVYTGINIQKNQTLVINASISAADFVRIAARKAYEAGAKNVHVEWIDDQLTLIKYLHAPEEAFTEFPLWKAAGYTEMAKGDAAFLYVRATDPDLLKAVEPSRIATANKTAAHANREFSVFTRSSTVSWTIVAVPNPEWAIKIFPHETPEKAVELLWEQIFRLTRADQEDPATAWEEHLSRLEETVHYLNKKKYRRLHYKGAGTDLTIGLPEQHIWIAAGEKNGKGISFVANIPTEEVFTCPNRDEVEGTVSTTKPLNYGGNLIENFTLTFKAGKVVDVKAEKGEEILKNLIATDEGASRLGEVALVPHKSPISDSNLIFYNTLFDENASCHLAIGSAFPTCIEGGTGMSKEDQEKHGLNQSLTHVDFMIGSAELDIDGETANGVREPLFRAGNWAF